MCRKLLFLIALLGLISTAWADDLNPPPWRGEPGSAEFHWTYDADAPNPTPDGYPRVDATDSEIIYPHPHKTDPGNYIERAYAEGWIWDTYWAPGGWVPAGEAYPGADYTVSGMQLWAQGPSIWVGPGPEDYADFPPTWNPTFMGRTGVLSDFYAGSWDIFNFYSDPPQPEKLMWIQLTWMPMDPTEPVTWFYELETFTDSGMGESWWNAADGWKQWQGWDEWEGPVGELPPSGEIWETWWEAGTGWMGWGQAWYENVWWETAGWHFDVMYDYMYSGDIVPFDEIDYGDGWYLSKFLLVADLFNPDVEFLGLFPSLPIAVDQIVIDTICIPEPATIALLGLGGLALIRRRKR